MSLCSSLEMRGETLTTPRKMKKIPRRMDSVFRTSVFEPECGDDTLPSAFSSVVVDDDVVAGGEEEEDSAAGGGIFSQWWLF
jgi:hypothetical protein